jgi:hypothetical protein
LNIAIILSAFQAFRKGLSEIFAQAFWKKAWLDCTQTGPLNRLCHPNRRQPMLCHQLPR